MAQRVSCFVIGLNACWVDFYYYFHQCYGTCVKFAHNGGLQDPDSLYTVLLSLLNLISYSTMNWPTTVVEWRELESRRQCMTRTPHGLYLRSTTWTTGPRLTPTSTMEPTHRTVLCPAAWDPQSTTPWKGTKTKYMGRHECVFWPTMSPCSTFTRQACGITF